MSLYAEMVVINQHEENGNIEDNNFLYHRWTPECRKVEMVLETIPNESITTYLVLKRNK